MPKTFDQLGLNLMYPDNWDTLPRAESEPPGVTFDLPGGGFLSLDQIDGENDEIVDAWLENSAKTIRDDYGEVETEELRTSDVVGFFRGSEFRFYYLDMIIVSQLMILLGPDSDWAVQVQAESRDFDANSKVYAAVLGQVVPKAG